MFGLGKSFETFYLNYNTEKYQIVAFSDNNRIWEGKFIQSVPVILPENIKDVDYDTLIVTSTVHFKEIKQQFLKYKIEEEKIKCYEKLSAVCDNHLTDTARRKMLLISSQKPLDINIETVSYCPLKCTFYCNKLYDRKK